MRPTHSKPIDAVKAHRILAALREGKTLAIICSGKVNGKRVSSEILTTYTRFREYCDANPTYAKVARPLLDANYKASNARKGRPLTHCKRGHLLSGDNLAYKKDCKNGKVYRYCIACHNYRGEHGAVMKPDQVRRVKAAVLAGLNITEITKGIGQQKGIVNFATLKRYRVDHPEFDRFIIENARDLLSRARLTKFLIVPTNAGFSYSAPNFQKPVRKEVPPFLFQDGDLEWVSSLIPRGLPSFVRDEIVQNAFAKLCERAVSRDEVPATVKRLVKDQAKLFPTMFRKFGDSPLVSLDELVFEDGSTTRGDMVTHGLWD